MTICLTHHIRRVKVIIVLIGLFCLAPLQAGAADAIKQGAPDDAQAPMILTGRFEGLTMDKAYIDGLGIKLAADVEMFAKDGDIIHKSKLKRGCIVKFVINNDKEIVMIQIESQP